MPKVVTSEGLTDFVQSGKHDTIAPQKAPEAKEAPALEVKKDAPVTEVKAEPKEEPKKEESKVEDEGLEPEDVNLSEIVRKKIGKKHRAMKEAQEAAADAESFAKNQYDRARLAEERAAQLEKELSEVKKVQAPSEPELKAPDKADAKYQVNGQFDWERFSADQAEYVADKKLKDFAAQLAKQQVEQQKAAAEAAFKARLTKATSKYPDFEEKIAASSTQFPNAVLQYITESDYGPDLTYTLATDPAAAERISKLPPIRAIAELGKLETTFEKPAEKKAEPPVVEHGGAPPPITPITGMGSGTVNTDPAKMNFRELRDYERARRQKR